MNGASLFLAVLGRRYLAMGSQERVLAALQALATAGKSVAKVRVYAMSPLTVRRTVHLA